MILSYIGIDRLCKIEINACSGDPSTNSLFTCLFQGTRGVITRKAVQLRNFVLLDYLDQVVSDIKYTPRSCFNTKVEISDSCPI